MAAGVGDAPGDGVGDGNGDGAPGLADATGPGTPTAGVGRATGALGAGAGVGAGSEKPGGSRDSGRSCAIAVAAATAATVPAISARLAREIAKLDRLLDPRGRLFRGAPGEEEQCAQHDDEQHQQGDDQPRHNSTLSRIPGPAQRTARAPYRSASDTVAGIDARCIARWTMLQSPPVTDEASSPAWTGQPIVLVGLMGAGKSTIGRRLATRLKLPFADADNEIEAAAGMTISDIFARFGEAYFRAGERRVIQRLIDGRPKVIATGGGAFVNDATRALILSDALAIWLDAPVEVLVERVQRRDTRPLLRGRDPAEVLRELAAIRNPLYALAPIRVPSAHAPHETTVRAILEALRQ